MYPPAFTSQLLNARPGGRPLTYFALSFLADSFSSLFITRICSLHHKGYRETQVDGQEETLQENVFLPYHTQRAHPTLGYAAHRHMTWDIFQNCYQKPTVFFENRYAQYTG